MKYSIYKRHYKNILSLGIPIVIGQLGIILVGFADNIMVGQFSANHLAAASFVNGVFNIPIFFGLGFSYGLTPLVGQMYGAKDNLRVSQYLKNSLYVNAFITLLLSFAMLLVYLNIEKFGQPVELIPIIKPYFLLHLVSLIFVMMFNSFKQFSDGINNSRTPMYIMLTANVVNVVGNYLLVYGKLGLPAMGVVGAGVATLLSRVLMLLLFVVVFFFRHEFADYAQSFKCATINKLDILLLNKMGWNVGIQMGLETSLFSIAAIMIGWLGAMALAAHQVLVTVSTLGFMLYYGIGAALSVRVSNHYGRGDMKLVKTTSMAGFHIIFSLALCASLVFFFLKDYLGPMFTANHEVGEMVSLLVWMLILYQFGDALQITYANVLRAVGDVTSLSVVSVVAYLFVAIPVCYICGFIFDWGILGIWVGFPVGLSVAGIIFALRFHYLLRKHDR